MDELVVACQNEREAPELLPYPAHLVNQATAALVSSKRAVVGLSRQHRRRLARIERRRRTQNSAENGDDQDGQKEPDATDDEDATESGGGRLIEVRVGGAGNNNGNNNSSRLSYCRSGETATTIRGNTALKTGYVSMLDILQQQQAAADFHNNSADNNNQGGGVKHEDGGSSKKKLKDGSSLLVSATPPHPSSIVGIVAAEFTTALGDETVTYSNNDHYGDYSTMQPQLVTDASIANLPFQPHDLINMELVRVEFLLSELLRVRIQKIQALAQRIYYYENIPAIIQTETEAALYRSRRQQQQHANNVDGDSKSSVLLQQLVVSGGGAGGASGLMQHPLVRRYAHNSLLLGPKEQLILDNLVQLYEKCASASLPSLSNYDITSSMNHNYSGGGGLQQAATESSTTLLGSARRSFYVPRIVAPTTVAAYIAASSSSSSPVHQQQQSLHLPMAPPVASASSGPNHTSAGGGCSRSSNHMAPLEHRHHNMLLTLAALRRDGSGGSETSPSAATLYPSPQSASTLVLPEPQLRKRVFYRIRRDIGTVELDSATSAERLMETGDVIMAPYCTLEAHLLRSDVRIL